MGGRFGAVLRVMVMLSWDGRIGPRVSNVWFWRVLPRVQGVLRRNPGLHAREKLSAEMKATRYGDPLGNDELDMGPIINKAGLAKIDELVTSAMSGGAQCVLGGKVADLGMGNHYEPTVLTNCRQDMDIIQKEIFGPVLPVITFSDIDQAIDYANDTVFGLTSSIYTTNLNTALRAANELHFGETYINRENFEAMQGYHAGHGRSGIGGADGKHGLLEYTQTHLAYIQT